jgi:hypothetical protein
MSAVLLLSLTAALNPTLLTATSLMLLLPDPKRLLLGYWLGAMFTSVTLGIVIVQLLSGSGAVSTTKRTLSPLADIAIGCLFLALAVVLGTGRDQRLRERRAGRKQDTGPPRWQRPLHRGTARTAFVVGALLTLPGASYLAGLSRISKLDYSTAGQVVTIIGFNLVMLILLEAPLLATVLYPESAAKAIERGKALIARHWRRYAIRALAILGAALIVKGIIAFLST